MFAMVNLARYTRINNIDGGDAVKTRQTFLVGWWVIIACTVSAVTLPPRQVNAVSQMVVIRSVLAADALDTNDELIEIENVSAFPVDITDWSLGYISSTNSISSLRQINASDTGARVMLPAGARETIFSTKYIANHPQAEGYTGAETFTGKMGFTTAGIELRDSTNTIIDALRWGAWDTSIDASPAVSMSTTTLLQRTGSDTDNNRNDFNLLPQTGQLFSYGQLYELVDQCGNIDGLQAEVPGDMIKNTEGNCVSADVCPNLDGVQLVVPAGKELYHGECLPAFVPAALFITELLPNPGGIDTGNEYLELYNASDSTVDLADYYMMVAGKQALFPQGMSLAAHGYLALSDVELAVIFPNTTGISVQLVSRNGLIIDTMPSYSNAGIDMAWAYVNDDWHYTNQPTPGSANQVSLVDDGQLPTPDPGVVACANGYYRNPLTNRCNKIKTDEVPVACQPNQYRSEETGRCRTYVTLGTPAVCKEGQYRSEETGRCRSIASAAAAVLKPCDDDQFRNPTTGRCKQIASVDDLPKPCAVGYERNPETNRCRKLTVSSMPLAAFPVEPIKPTSITVGVWLAAGGIVVCGLGYAAWEWRREIAAASSRLATHLGRK